MYLLAAHCVDVDITVERLLLLALFLSVKILSKNLLTEANTEEWACVAIPPHLTMTSHKDFCPEAGKFDLCALSEASKASLKVMAVSVVLLVTSMMLPASASMLLRWRPLTSSEAV
jgi:hypothetical protein